jgi:hypothetical protein
MDGAPTLDARPTCVSDQWLATTVVGIASAPPHFGGRMHPGIGVLGTGKDDRRAQGLVAVHHHDCAGVRTPSPSSGRCPQVAPGVKSVWLD